MCVKEGAPAIVSHCRWRYQVGAQYLADGASADPVPEAQLALNPNHARVPQMTGRSQADLIRDGISQVIHDHLATRPKMRARFHDPSIVGRTEELLEGLGE